jgi:hypothetical protein
MKGDLAAAANSGHMLLTRITGNTWISSHISEKGTPSFGGGNKTLSAELDQVRLTRTGGNSFDAGQVNILYE